MSAVSFSVPKMEDMCIVHTARDNLIYWIYTSGLWRGELEYAKIPAVNLLPARIYVSGSAKTLRDNRQTRRKIEAQR